MKEEVKKVCIIGDPGVGKTCLVKRLVDASFSEKYTHTTGTKMSKKELEFPDLDTRLSLQLYDVVGPKSISFLEGYIKGSAGIMAVCDITRDETLTSLEEWIASARQIAPDAPLVIVANKSDLTDDAMIDAQSVAIAARRFKAPYYMTSAKTGVNLWLVFGAMGRMVLGEAPLAT
jgi:small GTP-binding protein